VGRGEGEEIGDRGMGGPKLPSALGLRGVRGERHRQKGYVRVVLLLGVIAQPTGATDRFSKKTAKDNEKKSGATLILQKRSQRLLLKTQFSGTKRLGQRPLKGKGWFPDVGIAQNLPVFNYNGGQKNPHEKKIGGGPTERDSSGLHWKKAAPLC